MSASPIAQEMEPFNQDFGLEPFAAALQPLIDAALQAHDQASYRKGTVLIPRLLVWFVLALTLRRDKNYAQVLNWLVSGFRWSFFGESDVSIGISLGMTFGFLAACIAFVWWIFKTGWRIKS